MSRRVIQRTCVVFGIIALLAYLFYAGKGHTLLIDTNSVTIADKELRSAASVTVTINGKEQDPMGRAERIMVSVQGPSHTIVIVDDADSTKRVEKSFTIPTFQDTAVVSIPAILGNAAPEYWVTVFTPPPLEDAPIERMHREGGDATIDGTEGQTPESAAEGQSTEGQAADTPK